MRRASRRCPDPASIPRGNRIPRSLLWLAIGVTVCAGCGPAAPPQPPRAESPPVTLGGPPDAPSGSPDSASPPGTNPGARTGAAPPESDTSPPATPTQISDAPGRASPPADNRSQPPSPPGKSPEITENAPRPGDSPAAGIAGANPAGPGVAAAKAGPPAERTFRAEGPNGALRVTYDDFDLLKLLQMEPVTVDCVEKMPGWLRALDGKSVRLRGYMKPGFMSEGITRFLLVRDTGLCCYGPAGKIYDLVQVTLAEGQTTNYIELTPFDVVGTFRVRLDLLDEEAEDGTVSQMIIGLYHIENGRILRK